MNTKQMNGNDTESAPPPKPTSLVMINIAVVFFGIAGVLIGFVNADAHITALARYGIASLALAFTLVYKYRGNMSALKINSLAELKPLIISGALLAMHGFAFIAAIQSAGVSFAVITFFATMSTATIGINAILCRSLPGKKSILVLLLLLIGILAGDITVISRYSAGVGGIIWGLISGITYALRIIILNNFSNTKSMRKSPPKMIYVFYEQSVAAIIILISILNPFTSFTLTAIYQLAVLDMVLLFVLAVICTACANVWFFKGQRGLEPNAVAAVSCMELVYALSLTAVVLGDTPQDSQIIGASIVILALLVNSGLFEEQNRQPAL